MRNDGKRESNFTSIIFAHESVQKRIEKSLVSDFKLRFIPSISFRLREAGLFAFVEMPLFGVVVKWDGGLEGRGVGNRLEVRVANTWSGRVEGLCGDANEDAADDFKTPSKIVEATAEEFGNSWKLQRFCPNAAASKVDRESNCDRHSNRRAWANERCSVLSHSELFSRCRSVLPVAEWVERCEEDACGCDTGGDCECLCTVIAAYGQECAKHGVSVKWRSQELCRTFLQ